MTTPLEESIAHWEANYAAEFPHEPQTTSEHCPLCAVYLDNDDDVRCVGCPVREHTKLSGCAGTPWMVAAVRLDRWRGSKHPHHKMNWLSACRAEINFLKSLRHTEGVLPGQRRPQTPNSNSERLNQ
jgi:hypothetical protein